MRRLAILLLAMAAVGCSYEGREPAPSAAEPTSTATTTLPPVTSTTTVPPLDDDLRIAQETWREHGPATYRMWTRYICFGCDDGWIDLVADGEGVTHIPITTGGRSTWEGPGSRTIDDLYRLVMDLRSESHEVTVTFDDSTGAIELIGVNPDEHTADDGYGLHFTVEAGVTDLPFLPADVELATLTEPFECRWSLGLADPDTGSAIHVEAGSDDLVGGTFWLSEKFPAWSVVVRTATDESGLGCEYHRWSGPAAHAYAVDGRANAEFSQDGCFVRLTITDLVIEDHAGERVLPGDITLTSDRWGECFYDD